MSLLPPVGYRRYVAPSLTLTYRAKIAFATAACCFLALAMVTTVAIVFGQEYFVTSLGFGAMFVVSLLFALYYVSVDDDRDKLFNEELELFKAIHHSWLVKGLIPFIHNASNITLTVDDAATLAFVGEVWVAKRECVIELDGGENGKPFTFDVCDELEFEVSGSKTYITESSL